MLEKDGTLVANQVFRRDLATEYAIIIQVEQAAKVTFFDASKIVDPQMLYLLSFHYLIHIFFLASSPLFLRIFLSVPVLPHSPPR